MGVGVGLGGGGRAGGERRKSESIHVRESDTVSDDFAAACLVEPFRRGEKEGATKGKKKTLAKISEACKHFC